MRSVLIAAMLLLAAPALALPTYDIVEILDASGDGAGNALDSPFGVTADSAGNVYVTGDASNNVFRVTPGGTVTEIIDSTGDGTGNTLDVPLGVAVDSAGNVYVTGFLSHNAFSITPNGTITQIIERCRAGTFDEVDGTCSDGSDPLSSPLGVAVDSVGNVYLVGSISHNAFMITPSGTISEIIDDADGLMGPLDIGVDAAGNVFVAGATSNNVFEVSPSGTITEILNTSGDGAGAFLGTPDDLAVGSDGSVYVTGRFSDNAFRISPGGTVTEIIRKCRTGTFNAQTQLCNDGSDPLDAPFDIAVDPAGNVYVVGNLTDNAFIVTPAGTISQIVDATGDGMGAAFEEPRGIAADAAGNVYIASRVSNNVLALPEPGRVGLQLIALFALVGIHRARARAHRAR